MIKNPWGFTLLCFMIIHGLAEDTAGTDTYNCVGLLILLALFGGILPTHWRCTLWFSAVVCLPLSMVCDATGSSVPPVLCFLFLVYMALRDINNSEEPPAIK